MVIFQYYTSFMCKPTGNCVYILHTKIVQDVYNSTDIYKMYTKCIQKFVEIWYTFSIQTFCIHFVYKSLLKYGIHFVYIQTFYTFFMQNLYKSLTKCGIHFVHINFVYTLYKSILIYLKHTFFFLS